MHLLEHIVPMQRGAHAARHNRIILTGCMTSDSTSAIVVAVNRICYNTQIGARRSGLDATPQLISASEQERRPRTAVDRA